MKTFSSLIVGNSYVKHLLLNSWNFQKWFFSGHFPRNPLPSSAFRFDFCSKFPFISNFSVVEMILWEFHRLVKTTFLVRIIFLKELAQSVSLHLLVVRKSQWLVDFSIRHLIFIRLLSDCRPIRVWCVGRPVCLNMSLVMGGELISNIIVQLGPIRYYTNIQHSTQSTPVRLTFIRKIISKNKSLKYEYVISNF